ncbi:hypothetical protein AMTRI_Chr06g192740 [Amborella trichopoda]
MRRDCKMWISAQMFVILVLFISHDVRGGRATLGEELEAGKHLKLENRPIIKTIKSEDKAVGDCVDFYKQPAFDHPLLKNHSVQMKPSSYPVGFTSEKKVQSSNLQSWNRKDTCPPGTIPICRMTRDAMFNVSSIKNLQKKHPFSKKLDVSMWDGHEHAVVYVKGGEYFGAKANLSVWNPHTQPNEFSLSQIWVLSGPYEELNSVEAGWMAYPDVNGDNHTRIFTYWTGDGYKHTGCYNHLCPGFIQTSRDIALGAKIVPISSYGGNQYHIIILIYKDPKTANWWMIYKDEPVGYWPSSLFTSLARSANSIEWGGEVTDLQTDGKHTTTQMGSGHWPSEGWKKAAFISNLQIVDGSNYLRRPEGLKTIAEKEECYSVQIGGQGGKNWGDFMYYGGPGSNPNCP